MSPRRLHALLALAALAVAGCGGSDDPEGEPLPQAAVTQLESRLDEVQNRYDAGTQEGIPGACEDLEDDSYPAIDDVVAGLPQDVDPEVRQALEESIARLRELTSDCLERAEEQEPDPEPVPEEPIPEETIPEETIPEETTPEETRPPREDEESDDDGGLSPGQGGTPPGQGGTPPGQGGGERAPTEDD